MRSPASSDPSIRANSIGPGKAQALIELATRNTPYDNLVVGAECEIDWTCTAHDLTAFALACGDSNPLDWPGRDVDADGRDDVLAPTTWLAALASTAISSLLPGPGTVIQRLDLGFPASVRIGDHLRLRLRCEVKRARPLVDFSVAIMLSDGTTVMEGVATVVAPLENIALERVRAPLLIIDAFDHFGPLIARCKPLRPLVTGIVWPVDETSLGGALLAAREGLIEPVLIGVSGQLEAVALKLGASLQGIAIEEADDPQQAAALGVSLVHAGRVNALMKGNLHSDTLLAEVVKTNGGLRLDRRISHAFVIDAPTLDHLLFVSDAAINVAPDLMTKVDITQNAIDLAQACGIAVPKVGILSAVETVNPTIPSTLDAAILSKMAERGQIHGGIVDGPLAMDNAIDASAARTKGIASLVAGQADVLIVPNLESGNILAKELTFIGRAESAGLVLGAKVPIILTSRADNDRARLASCALAQLYEYWRLNKKALTPVP
jgi:phosphotransacetylase/acyl dehydratase